MPHSRRQWRWPYSLFTFTFSSRGSITLLITTKKKSKKTSGLRHKEGFLRAHMGEDQRNLKITEKLNAGFIMKHWKRILYLLRELRSSESRVNVTITLRLRCSTELDGAQFRLKACVDKQRPKEKTIQVKHFWGDDVRRNFRLARIWHRGMSLAVRERVIRENYRGVFQRCFSKKGFFAART